MDDHDLALVNCLLLTTRLAIFVATNWVFGYLVPFTFDIIYLSCYSFSRGDSMKKNSTQLSLWKILLIALAFVAGSFLAKMVFLYF